MLRSNSKQSGESMWKELAFNVFDVFDERIFHDGEFNVYVRLVGCNANAIFRFLSAIFWICWTRIGTTHLLAGLCHCAKFYLVWVGLRTPIDAPNIERLDHLTPYGE